MVNKECFILARYDCWLFIQYCFNKLDDLQLNSVRLISMLNIKHKKARNRYFHVFKLFFMQFKYSFFFKFKTRHKYKRYKTKYYWPIEGRKITTGSWSTLSHITCSANFFEKMYVFGICPIYLLYTSRFNTKNISLINGTCN